VSIADRDKWDRKYAEREGPGEPSAFLRGLDGVLPRSGRALDVAGGAGRHALWLARRGLEVTIADVSAVGLELATRTANAEGLDIDTACVDLAEAPLPAGPWDVIVSFHYLQRDLFAAFASELAPGGYLVFCQATRTNLERHQHPSARFLLDDGELPGLIAELPLEVVSYAEGWSVEGRHEAELVAVRRS
jgi:2-polyprenyl-3-methyl-5-hydroxy-6-metoxy-1,4-benzoquinol methylase